MRDVVSGFIEMASSLLRSAGWHSTSKTTQQTKHFSCLIKTKTKPGEEEKRIRMSLYLVKDKKNNRSRELLLTYYISPAAAIGKEHRLSFASYKQHSAGVQTVILSSDSEVPLICLKLY